MYLSRVGKYYYVWYEDQLTGKRKKVSTGHTRKSDATRYLSEFRSNLSSRTPRRTTLTQFCQRYLEYSRVNHARSTTTRLQYVLKHFQAFMGELLLTSVATADIEAYKAARLKSVTPVTVNIELRTLKGFFSTAVKWDLIERSPFRNVKLLALPEPSPKHLSKQEYLQLLAAITLPWLREVVIFAANTGLRRSEITNLRWQQVDMGRRIIRVGNSAEFQTKSKRQRMVPLNDAATSVVSRIPKGSKYVFTNTEGRRLREGYLSQCFKAAVERAKLGKPICFHSLRHTFASWLVQAGAGIYEVQKLLGHSSVSVTQVYSHLAPCELHATVNRIDLSSN